MYKFMAEPADHTATTVLRSPAAHMAKIIYNFRAEPSGPRGQERVAVQTDKTV
jgi:hypothetical protein